VMRCLALAQAWQDVGGSVTFAIREAPLAIKQRLIAEGFSIIRTAGTPGSAADAGSTAALAHKLGARWIVVDGDRFEASFLERLRSPGLRILLMDDFAGRKSFPADLVVNPNLGFKRERYRDKVPDHALLLGSSYVFLRREFGSLRGKRVFPKTGNRILVTLGGSDPENLAPKIARTLAEIPEYEITLVAGPGYTHTIESPLQANRNIRIVRNPPNMPALMARADIAIIAGGGTLWELLYMGCAVLSYSRNEVQQQIVDELAARDATHDMGATKKFKPTALVSAVAGIANSKSRRMKMSKIGRQVLDGLGTVRILRAMSDAGVETNVVTMMPVVSSERSQFLNMARNHFLELDSSFVPRDDWKQQYFDTIQANRQFFLRWILHNGDKAGFILFGTEKHRFLPRKTGMIYELYIAPEFRKRGIARACAAQAIAELQNLGPTKIQLEVMEGNTAAVALWKSLQFLKVSERYVLAGGVR
jgi:UDP-2,4-diacetamido-2,4,6-trideoxy-beta-L-altropyranose hydrolase